MNDKKNAFIQFLPVSFFGAIMGLSGLCFSWRLASDIWKLPKYIGEIIGFTTLFAFVVLTTLYLLKIKIHKDLVKKEFEHPVSVSLFGAFIISLLLIPGIILPYNMTIAFAIWIIGTLLMFSFSFMVIRKWMDKQQDPANAMPVWIIPIAGTLDVPIIGLKFPYEWVHELCTFFFGVGLIFSFILITIILYRLIFQSQLPIETQPTQLILVAPFALAFSGYLEINHTLDLIGRIFFYFDLFLFIVLFSKILMIPKCCPFKVSWWAVSFPLVAITIAALKFAKMSHIMAINYLAIFLIILSSFVIIYLLSITLNRILRGTY